MRCRDFILTSLAVIVGGSITLFGEYLSRRDHHSQDQLKFFRDHAIKDTIQVSNNLDEIYEECLICSKENLDLNKNSPTRSRLTKKISLYSNNLDFIKLDFAYFKIIPEDIFTLAEGYLDNLNYVLFTPKRDGKKLSDRCNDNIHKLKQINKMIKDKIIKEIKKYN